MTQAVIPHAFFLAAPAGQRFCVHHAPKGAPRALVLYLHPWGEEMNKSRRMAALQARALADAGCAVLQLDLQGCGDSSDTWAEASWQGWVDDALLALQWLRQRWPQAAHADAPPLWLWGLRAGCLVASAAAARLAEPCHFLFWQPAPAGKPLLQQFLRLKAAADLQGDAKAVLAGLRQGLAAGQAQDVAGYSLSPTLAGGLEQAQLMPAPRGAAGSRVVWLEVSSRERAALLPASQPCIAAWGAAGHAVDAAVVPGPAFWQTQEIEDAPALLAATLDALALAEPA